MIRPELSEGGGGGESAVIWVQTSRPARSYLPATTALAPPLRMTVQGTCDIVSVSSTRLLYLRVVCRSLVSWQLFSHPSLCDPQLHKDR